jgi:hypothetical protein
MFAAAVGFLQASTALAQVVSQSVEPSAAPGWSLTPSIAFGGVADDNVLMQGNEAKAVNVSGDLLSVVTPRASLDFNSRRGHLTLDYTGSFELYRQFDSLDNFNQFEAVSARRQMASHTSLFVQQQFAMMPTTALPPLAGIPYVRVGARILGLRMGVEHAFTKRTTLSANYNFQSVRFDKDPVTGLVLVGGFGNGASATLRHEMSARITLVVDYDLQRTSVIDNGVSTVSNARAGGEYRFSETSSVFAEAGIARLRPNAFTPAHMGPSGQAGVIHKLRRTTVDVTYTRGYVPSFGNGATVQSDDLGAHLKMTVSRRMYTQGSLDVRHDVPLPGTFVAPLGEQALRSLLFGGLVGYSASQRIRIEGFFMATRQSVDRPGGNINVNRVGIQVVTGKPMRLR